MSKLQTALAQPGNLQQLEQLYDAWKANPEGVDADWQAFFAGFELGLERMPETAIATRAAGALVKAGAQTR